MIPARRLAVALLFLAGSPGAADAETLPNPFRAMALGDATLYDTHEGRRLRIYARKTKDGHVERVYAGCPVNADPKRLGEPVAKEFFDAAGRLVRIAWSAKKFVTYRPHNCATTLGRCVGEVYGADATGADRARFEQTLRRDGARLSFAMVLTKPDGAVADYSGWFDLSSEGKLRTLHATFQPRGGPARKMWSRRVAGPAPLSAVCAGAS